MKQTTRYFTLILLLFSNLIVGQVNAGTLTNASITPADLSVSANTTYTVKFTTVSPIATGYDIYIYDDNADLANNVCNPIGGNDSCTKFSTANPVAFSQVNEPASLQNSLVARPRASGAATYLEVTNGGSAGGSVVVEFVLIDVTNPAIGGTGEQYTIQIQNGNIVIDSVIVPGINFGAATGPVVSNNIPDKLIYADEGTNAIDLDPAVPVVTDLNFTFTDDNAETLSFSIVAGHDTTVVTASISGNELLLTGLKTGSTNVTVRADDQSGNFVTDTFTVNSIGTLDPASVTPASLLAADTTSYTISFKPAVALSAGDDIILSGGSVTDYVGATLGSISGGTLGVNSVTTANAGQSLVLDLTGSASTSDTVSIVIDNITNPGSGGQSASYVLETRSLGSSTNGRSTIAGNTFNASSAPAVVHLIPTQGFNQEDSPYTVDVGSGITDLHDVFVDGDMDPLTFSIDSVADTGVVMALINPNDEIVLSGQGGGSTTVTVKATAIDGSVTTSFQVNVTASLTPASVTPASLFTNTATNYTVTLTPQENMSIGHTIRLNTGSGFDQTSSTLVSLGGGAITAGSKISGSGNSTVVSITSGSVNAGEAVTMVLSGIINPSSVGMGADYEIIANDGSSNIGVSSVTGHIFSVAPDEIFTDGFEESIVILAAKKHSGIAQ